MESCFATWTSRIPSLRDAMNLSHTGLGTALFGLALGALIALPLAGWLAPRVGGHRLTLVLGFGFCACLVLPALAGTPLALWMALFLFGVMHGALDVSMNAQASEVEKLYRRPIMSSFHALWSLGGFIGAVFGVWMASLQVGVVTHFSLVTLATLLAVAAWVLPCRWPERQSRCSGTEKRDEPRRPGTKPVLIGLGVIAFSIMIGEGAIADWSAVFLRDQLRVSDGMAAAGYACFAIAMMMARIAGDQLALRLGPDRLVRIGSCVAAVGLGATILSAHYVPALIGFALVGAGYATIIPQVFSAAGKVKGIAAGPALATTATFGYFGFLIGPPLIGLIAEKIGLGGALALVAAINLLPVPLAFLLRSPQRELQVPVIPSLSPPEHNPGGV
ncbi:MAG: MFS transporter [Verrucomicrobiales bacterium]|nr:MFS transporter [Verrucomicrobiales bacterium]